MITDHIKGARKRSRPRYALRGIIQVDSRARREVFGLQSALRTGPSEGHIKNPVRPTGETDTVAAHTFARDLWGPITLQEARP